MTSVEIKERIEKALKKVEAKKATIVKKTNWIASGKKDEWEIHWLKEDITRLEKEIVATEETIEKYKKQIDGAIEAENIFEHLPVILKDIEKELCERWNVHDIARMHELREKYRNEVLDAPRKEYYDRVRDFHHKHMDWRIKDKSEEEIMKDNAKGAHLYVLDLYRRVYDITGEITAWEDLHANGVALNGFVIGKAGRAEVETILAGGYNIQRLHCRTLVHSR